MELLSGQAHIWIMPMPAVPRETEAPGDDPVIKQLASVLSAGEIDRSKRFHFENDRREYVAAHALCRIMLSRFAETRPTDWQFEAGPHGRPEIAGPDRQYGLRFNLSHTRGMVCVAITRDDDIGVDVEWMGRHNQLEDIAHAKFSKPEVVHFQNVPAAEKIRCFFSFWTLKEAYIKAIGKGLREPLDGFAFTLDPLTIDFVQNQDDPENWRFLLMEPVPDYMCALAIRNNRGHELKDQSQLIDIKELFSISERRQ